MSKVNCESIQWSLTLDKWTSGINTVEVVRRLSLDAAIAQLPTTLGRFQSATWQDTGSEDREHPCLLVSQQIRLGHSQGKAASGAVAALSAEGTGPIR